ncbi:IS110 family transposase [Sphingobium phenoxybenzoativorans]|uniref:IS110 family transposase n=1 Tax=Sphingobium phenoxybenzoativorans TaxID=1592790 RepID=UPI000872B1F3|nr:IS110 family transposase [Sphingobium phenoxybenzoativorans]
MMSNNSQYVAIDVSKSALDIAMPGANRIWRSSNTLTGVAALRKRLQPLEHPHIVCEATGRYARLLAQQMEQANIPLSIVNPRQVRDFARATGQLAKTDALDASIILRFADAMQPAPTPPTPENQVRLAEQVRRRRQLVDMLATEKQRLCGLDNADTLASIRAHITFLQGQIDQCDARIKAEIGADASLTRKAALLESIPGIGATTAAVLIAELPELGRADKKQIAALAGVAPMNRDSGQWRGQAHITGGRLSVRCALYMATLPAIRCNPTIRAFYQHLRAQGKAPKVAITAAMRKLLIIANTIVQHDKPWANLA